MKVLGKINLDILGLAETFLQRCVQQVMNGMAKT